MLMLALNELCQSAGGTDRMNVEFKDTVLIDPNYGLGIKNSESELVSTLGMESLVMTTRPVESYRLPPTCTRMLLAAQKGFLLQCEVGIAKLLVTDGKKEISEFSILTGLKKEAVCNQAEILEDSVIIVCKEQVHGNSHDIVSYVFGSKTLKFKERRVLLAGFTRNPNTEFKLVRRIGSGKRVKLLYFARLTDPSTAGPRKKPDPYDFEANQANKYLYVLSQTTWELTPIRLLASEYNFIGWVFSSDELANPPLVKLMLKASNDAEPVTSLAKFALLELALDTEHLTVGPHADVLAAVKDQTLANALNSARMFQFELIQASRQVLLTASFVQASKEGTVIAQTRFVAPFDAPGQYELQAAENKEITKIQIEDEYAFLGADTEDVLAFDRNRRMLKYLFLGKEGKVVYMPRKLEMIRREGGHVCASDALTIDCYSLEQLYSFGELDVSRGNRKQNVLFGGLKYTVNNEVRDFNRLFFSDSYFEFGVKIQEEPLNLHYNPGEIAFMGNAYNSKSGRQGFYDLVSSHQSHTLRLVSFQPIVYYFEKADLSRALLVIQQNTFALGEDLIDMSEEEGIRWFSRCTPEASHVAERTCREMMKIENTNWEQIKVEYVDHFIIITETKEDKLRLLLINRLKSGVKFQVELSGGVRPFATSSARLSGGRLHLLRAVKAGLEYSLIDLATGQRTVIQSLKIKIDCLVNVTLGEGLRVAVISQCDTTASLTEYTFMSLQPGAGEPTTLRNQLSTVKLLDGVCVHQDTLVYVSAGHVYVVAKEEPTLLIRAGIERTRHVNKLVCLSDDRIALLSDGHIVLLRLDLILGWRYSESVLYKIPDADHIFETPTEYLVLTGQNSGVPDYKVIRKQDVSLYELAPNDKAGQKYSLALEHLNNGARNEAQTVNLALQARPVQEGLTVQGYQKLQINQLKSRFDFGKVFDFRSHSIDHISIFGRNILNRVDPNKLLKAESHDFLYHKKQLLFLKHTAEGFTRVERVVQTNNLVQLRGTSIYESKSPSEQCRSIDVTILEEESVFWLKCTLEGKSTLKFLREEDGLFAVSTISFDQEFDQISVVKMTPSSVYLATMSRSLLQIWDVTLGNAKGLNLSSQTVIFSHKDVFSAQNICIGDQIMLLISMSNLSPPVIYMLENTPAKSTFVAFDAPILKELLLDGVRHIACSSKSNTSHCVTTYADSRLASFELAFSKGNNLEVLWRDEYRFSPLLRSKRVHLEDGLILIESEGHPVDHPEGYRVENRVLFFTEAGKQISWRGSAYAHEFECDVVSVSRWDETTALVLNNMGDLFWVSLGDSCLVPDLSSAKANQAIEVGNDRKRQAFLLSDLFLYPDAVSTEAPNDSPSNQSAESAKKEESPTQNEEAVKKRAEQQQREQAEKKIVEAEAIQKKKAEDGKKVMEEAKLKAEIDQKKREADEQKLIKETEEKNKEIERQAEVIKKKLEDEEKKRKIAQETALKIKLEEAKLKQEIENERKAEAKKQAKREKEERKKSNEKTEAPVEEKATTESKEAGEPLKEEKKIKSEAVINSVKYYKDNKLDKSTDVEINSEFDLEAEDRSRKWFYIIGSLVLGTMGLLVFCLMYRDHKYGDDNPIFDQDKFLKELGVKDSKSSGVIAEGKASEPAKQENVKKMEPKKETTPEEANKRGEKEKSGKEKKGGKKK